MKTMFLMSLVFLSISVYSQSGDANYYTTIAQEAYDTSEYQLAIDKCNVLLKTIPDNTDCKEIIKKANVGLEEQREAKRKADIQEEKEARIREKEEEKGEVLYAVCQGRLNIIRTKEHLALMKETTRKSGMVNRESLYRTNMALIALEKDLAQGRVKYKKIMGKDFVYSKKLCEGHQD